MRYLLKSIFLCALALIIDLSSAYAQSSADINPTLEVKLLQLDSLERSYQTRKSSDSKAKLVQSYSSLIEQWCGNFKLNEAEQALLKTRCAESEDKFLELSTYDFSKFCQRLKRTTDACIKVSSSDGAVKKQSPLEEIERMLDQSRTKRPTPSIQAHTTNQNKASNALAPEREQVRQLVSKLTRALSDYRTNPIPAKRNVALASYYEILGKVCPDQKSPLLRSPECSFYHGELTKFEPNNLFAACLKEGKLLLDCAPLQKAENSSGTKLPAQSQHNNEIGTF